MQGWDIARRRSNSGLDDIAFKGFPLRPAALVTFVRKMGFVGAIACFASPTAALAGEPRPDASIKTMTFEARVFLDDKIKADAALSADCLRRGKKWVGNNCAAGESSPKQGTQRFRDGGWKLQRKDSSRTL